MKKYKFEGGLPSKIPNGLILTNKQVRINTLSGGAQSSIATWLDFQNHPDVFHLLYFCDTGAEHKSTYKFIDEWLKILELDYPNADSAYVQIKEMELWELFTIEKFQGNGKNAVCSRKLKQEPGRKLENFLGLANAPITFGFSMMEQERLDYVKTKKPNAKAPLIEDYPKTFWDKTAMYRFIQSKNIELPYLYKIGMSHNNCGGFCVKAGQAHYAKLLKKDPELYAKHEDKQEKFIKSLPETSRDKVGFITVQRKGQKYYLTLKQFRLWVQAGKPYDPLDLGSCSCFSQTDFFQPELPF